MNVGAASITISAWEQLSAAERAVLAPKLTADHRIAAATGELPVAAAARFNDLINRCESAALPSTVNDRLLTAQNFIAQAGGHNNSNLWQQIVEIKGFCRSYLELIVRDRAEFLRVLAARGYVINREPFWSIHRFDSARAVTDYAFEPSLHFANDRAAEPGYGPNYFFVHWDQTSCWFRRSHWRLAALPGARRIEQLCAAAQHRFGNACPQQVSAYLQQARG